VIVAIMVAKWVIQPEEEELESDDE
jgi:hypothetical protein